MFVFVQPEGSCWAGQSSGMFRTFQNSIVFLSFVWEMVAMNVFLVQYRLPFLSGLCFFSCLSLCRKSSSHIISCPFSHPSLLLSWRLWQSKSLSWLHCCTLPNFFFFCWILGVGGWGTGGGCLNLESRFSEACVWMCVRMRVSVCVWVCACVYVWMSARVCVHAGGYTLMALSHLFFGLQFFIVFRQVLLSLTAGIYLGCFFSKEMCRHCILRSVNAFLWVVGIPLTIFSETDEAPERAKRFSTTAFQSLSGCFQISFFLFQTCIDENERDLWRHKCENENTCAYKPTKRWR